MKAQLAASVLFERFWSLAGSVNVRVKILGIVLGMVLALAVGITLQVRRAITVTLTAQLAEQSVAAGRDLAARSADLVLLNNLYGLHRLLQETQANNASLRYAFVTDAQGRILAHTFGDSFPLALADVNAPAVDGGHHTVILDTDEGLVWDTAVPVLGGQVGAARVGFSDTLVRQALRDVTGQLILTTILVAAIGVTAAAFLTWVLTRPLIELVQATRSIAGGNFSYRVKKWADDEIGDLEQAFNHMAEELSRVDELRREREQLRRQLLEKVIQTQEEERKRIARELHDSTSQNLTSLLVGLKVLENSCPDCRVQEQARELREAASQALEEVHTLAMQLRPRLLDDLGLAAALEKLVSDWQARHKIPVDLLIHLGGEGRNEATGGGENQRLPGVVETTIFRIVQEALTNVARHAQASSVSVLVERRGDEVVAVIEDNGVGFPAEDVAVRIVGESGRPRLGILGIRERSELLGGRLTIESSPKAGASVFVSIPLTGSLGSAEV